MECDFCSAPDPTWKFNAGSSLTTIASKRVSIIEDTGDGWAACDVCANMIRNNEREALRLRSVAEFYPAHPEYKHAPIDLVETLVTFQHSGFWKTKLDNGTVIPIIRTEFGAQRTTCACETCINNCRHMPGMLLPSDLEHMTRGVTDIEEWALRNLLASPGAIVRRTDTGKTFCVRTLVPAVKQDGSCIHLNADNRCDIHAIAPFGCAFFDCKSGHDGTAEQGVLTILHAHKEGEVYGELWRYLWEMGKRQHAPEVLRGIMRDRRAS